MKKLALGLSAIMVGAYPAASTALGLGEIESSSHINQPLKAHIELLSARPSDAQKLQVRLASGDTYARVGLQKPDHNLRFTATTQNGRPIILVTTDKPVPDPTLVFLVEVSWPQGQLLKEYTVLLDPAPAVVAPPGNNVARDTAAVRAEPAITEKKPQVKPPSASQNAKPKPATSTKLKEFRVRRGDTLGKLAARARYKGTSIEQMMVALFRANPQAFHKNNINLLKSGVILRRPGKSEISSIRQADAKKLVRRHHALWREQRTKQAQAPVSQSKANASAQASAANKKPNTKSSTKQTASAESKDNSLEILGNKASSATAEKTDAGSTTKITKLERDLAQLKEALASQQRKNSELESRVQALKSTLDKKDRLIQMQNDKVASLEKNLTNSSGASSEIIRTTPADIAKNTLTAPPASMTAPDADTNPQTVQANANIDQPEAVPVETEKAKSPMQLAMEQRAQQQAEAEKAAQEANAETSASTRISPAENTPVEENTTANNNTEKESSSFLSSLLDSNLLAYLGGGGLLLLLVGWLWQRKRRKTEDDEAAVTVPVSPGSSITDEEIERLTHALNEPDVNADSKTSDSINRVSDDLDQQVKVDNAFNALKKNEFNATPKATEAQRIDDVHGLASDAPITDEVLAEADVYIAYGLHQQAEAELQKALKDHPDRMNYRAKLLENYFNSNNQKSFDQEAQAYLNTEGEHKEKLWPQVAEMGRKLSPDNAMYMSDKVDESKAAMAGDALSNAAAVAAGTAAAAGLGAAAVTALSDDDAKQDSTPSNEDTQQHKAAEVATTDATDNTLDFDNDLFTESKGQADFDADESLIPMAADSFGSDEKQDSNASALSLEKQLAEFESTLDETDEDKPKIADPFESDLDNIVDFDELSADSDEHNLPSMSDNFDAQEALAASSSSHVDNVVDFEHAKGNIDAESELPNLSLEIDQNSGLKNILPEDTAYTSTENQELGDLDSMLDELGDDFSFLDLPDDDLDLQEAQVSTKLDLARAYIDMGDIEGARSTLEEVMVEGNDDQKREAEELLHQTG